MQVIDSYKTFNKETGEIRIECSLVKDDVFKIIQNGEVLQEFKTKLKAKQHFGELICMDVYIASRLSWLEVVK